MSEYWTEKDVMENAILDLQHERDDLQAELARRDERIERLEKVLEQIILLDLKPYESEYFYGANKLKMIAYEGLKNEQKL
jgi:hypothetical protein